MRRVEFSTSARDGVLWDNRHSRRAIQVVECRATIRNEPVGKIVLRRYLDTLLVERRLKSRRKVLFVVF